MDDGQTWSKTDVFGGGVKDAHPNMCAFDNADGSDTVLVASGRGFSSPHGMVAKSIDHGATFTRLADLPLGGPYIVNGIAHSGVNWLYMDVGTKASWGVGPADSDIYVFGSIVMDSYWSGLLFLVMTVSHDNGATWESPRLICSSLSYYPEVTSDGQNIYVVFSSLVPDSGYASLYAVQSSDWGLTWTAPKMIYQRTFSDGGCDSCSIQNLGDGTALLTASDHRPIYTDNKGIWGILRYSDLTFDLRGYVSGADWCVDLGFAGKLTDDGRLALGWGHRNYDANGFDLQTTDNRFSYGTNVGLGEQKVIAATVDVDSNTLNPTSNGIWVTAYIGLPDDYSVTDISISSVLLNGIVPASGPSEIKDFDHDRALEIMLKFSRADVVASLGVSAEMTLTVSGSLYDGTLFLGSDTVRIV
jgi:hypothetical protein